MFSKPHCGWVTVTLGEFTDRASYLTDVPVDCLDALIFAVDHYRPAAIRFDAEGWEYTITFTMYETYIVRIKDCTELFIVNEDMIDIAKEVISDIERDYKSWMDWDDFNDGELYVDDAIEIPEKLSILKALVKKHEKNVHGIK